MADRFGTTRLRSVRRCLVSSGNVRRKSRAASQDGIPEREVASKTAIITGTLIPSIDSSIIASCIWDGAELA